VPLLPELFAICFSLFLPCASPESDGLDTRLFSSTVLEVLKPYLSFFSLEKAEGCFPVPSGTTRNISPFSSIASPRLLPGEE